MADITYRKHFDYPVGFQPAVVDRANFVAVPDHPGRVGYTDGGAGAHSYYMLHVNGFTDSLSTVVNWYVAFDGNPGTTRTWSHARYAYGTINGGDIDYMANATPLREVAVSRAERVNWMTYGSNGQNIIESEIDYLDPRDVATQLGLQSVPIQTYPPGSTGRLLTVGLADLLTTDDTGYSSVKYPEFAWNQSLYIAPQFLEPKLFVNDVEIPGVNITFHDGEWWAADGNQTSQTNALAVLLENIPIDSLPEAIQRVYIRYHCLNIPWGVPEDDSGSYSMVIKPRSTGICELNPNVFRDHLGIQNLASPTNIGEVGGGGDPYADLTEHLAIANSLKVDSDLKETEWYYGETPTHQDIATSADLMKVRVEGIVSDAGSSSATLQDVQDLAAAVETTYQDAFGSWHWDKRTDEMVILSDAGVELARYSVVDTPELSEKTKK